MTRPLSLFRRGGILLPALLAGLAPAARGELRCLQASADAGETRRGPVLAQRFTLVNDGPRPVEIIDVKAACGCLKPRLSSQQLPPGGECTLDLEVNTLSQPAGPNVWRVHVQYREGDRTGDATVQLAARLVAEIDVQPAALNVVCGPRAMSHEITVTDSRPRPLTVIAVQTSSPHLKAVCQPPTRDAGGRQMQQIRVEVSADYPEGRHDEVVGICTDDPAYHEMSVPVTVIKRGRQRLSAAPDRVTIAGNAGQPLPSLIVLLRDAEEQAVVVEDVTADDPAVVCRWAQGPGAMATLKIQVNEAERRGRDHIESLIHVRVKTPAGAALTVPVEVLLRP